jgi:hypothetical protein
MNAQKSKEATMFEKLNLKSIVSVIDEEIGEETKVLRVNRNEYFKSEEKEADKIALSYLQAKHDVYGLRNDLNDVKIVKIMNSPSGKYVYCQQYMDNIPVFATNFAIYINKENIVMYTLNEFRNIAKYGYLRNNSLANDSIALKIANEYLGIKGEIIGEPKTELVYFESIDKGLELAWKINIISMEPMGDWQIFVSANDEHIIHVEDISMSANVNGQVFMPNPLISAGVPYGYNNCYLHGNGANNTCLQSQLQQVTLNDIFFENGVYRLEGPYCFIADMEPPGYSLWQTHPNFLYSRPSPHFDAVMCYYYVDLSARRILELDYNLPNGLRSLKVDPHGVFGERNAVYRNSGNYLAFGSSNQGQLNFVNAAQDADVILHEYGHAMQYNLGSGNISTTVENRSVKEGSSDYWATSYKRSLYPNNWSEFALWFQMTDPCRRTDLNWVYPTDYDPVQWHNGGQIWSSALMKIWGDLGGDTTDQLFLETHFSWGLSPNMSEAATAFMQADLHLYNGSHWCEIYPRFEEHGLIDTNQILHTTNFINQTVSTSRIVFSCTNLNVQNVSVRSGAKLELDALGEITINEEFEVELGSELEIW